MKKAWIDLCEDYFYTKKEISGTSKYYQCQTKIITDLTPNLSMQDMGYRNNKIKQLIRNYFNEESTKQAVEEFKKRSNKTSPFSISASCRGIPKAGNKSLDYCLQGYVLVGKGDKTCKLIMMYRTTEVVKKFYADLVFFQEYILPKFDFKNCPITEVHIMAGNITANFLYYPLLIPHQKLPIQKLKNLKIKDQNAHDKAIYLLDYVINKKTTHGGINNLKRSVNELYSDELMLSIKNYIKKEK
jgi:hypothetical protein